MTTSCYPNALLLAIARYASDVYDLHSRAKRGVEFTRKMWAARAKRAALREYDERHNDTALAREIALTMRLVDMGGYDHERNVALAANHPARAVATFPSYSCEPDLDGVF